jgi:hypothetical protein
MYLSKFYSSVCTRYCVSSLRNDIWTSVKGQSTPNSHSQHKSFPGRRHLKGRSRIVTASHYYSVWRLPDSNIWSWIPWDSNLRITVLTRPSRNLLVTKSTVSKFYPLAPHFMAFLSLSAGQIASPASCSQLTSLCRIRDQVSHPYKTITNFPFIRLALRFHPHPLYPKTVLIHETSMADA